MNCRTKCLILRQNNLVLEVSQSGLTIGAVGLTLTIQQNMMDVANDAVVGVEFVQDEEGGQVFVGRHAAMVVFDRTCI